MSGSRSIKLSRHSRRSISSFSRTKPRRGRSGFGRRAFRASRSATANSRWEKGKSNELLLQKLASIAFTISEEESLDITGVVERLRDSLDRDKVTKKFYEQFKTQKDAFRKFIKGISDSGLWDWYTSLMLNRLMFCYFLQRKGFLDGDLNYLSNRLERVGDEFGKGQFHSFYKSFLRRLFHEGLGAPKDERAADLKKLIGDVPYLNGGIFEEHKIERDHPGSPYSR